MNNEPQPQLNNPSNPGPVFDSGPGWGGRLRKLLSGSAQAGEPCALCAAVRYILPIIAVVVLSWGIISIVSNNPDKLVLNNDPADDGRVIIQDIRRGDSITHLSRRALSGYLATNTNENLTPGQRIFIENRLAGTLTTGKLIIGEKIEFPIENIEQLIAESKSLKPSTLQKWENYTKGVRFE